MKMIALAFANPALSSEEKFRIFDLSYDGALILCSPDFEKAERQHFGFSVISPEIGELLAYAIRADVVGCKLEAELDEAWWRRHNQVSNEAYDLDLESEAQIEDHFSPVGLMFVDEAFDLSDIEAWARGEDLDEDVIGEGDILITFKTGTPMRFNTYPEVDVWLSEHDYDCAIYTEEGYDVWSSVHTGTALVTFSPLEGGEELPDSYCELCGFRGSEHELHGSVVVCPEYGEEEQLNYREGDQSEYDDYEADMSASLCPHCGSGADVFDSSYCESCETYASVQEEVYCLTGMDVLKISNQARHDSNQM